MLNSCQGLKSYNAVLRPKIAQWVELHVKIIKDLSSQQEKRTVSPNPLKRFKPKTHIRRFVPGLASVISGLSKLLKKEGGGWIHLGNWAAGSFSEDLANHELSSHLTSTSTWVTHVAIFSIKLSSYKSPASTGRQLWERATHLLREQDT